MAVRNRRILVAIAGVAMAAGSSACTELRAERLGVFSTDSGSVAFISCANAAPSSATLWRVDSSKLVGDQGDAVVWGPSSDWTPAGEHSLMLDSEVAWDSRLVAAIDSDTSPALAIGEAPSAGFIRDMNGVIDAVEQVDAACD